MNPNAGKEGENDFMQISKDDRDTIMRGGEGAQNLLTHMWAPSRTHKLNSLR